MLSPAKFKMLYNQQHAAVRKVYDAVPMSEAWDHSQIIGELRRVGHSMRDMSVVLGCLDTLRRQGLVNEPQKGFFSRVQIRDPKPTNVCEPTPHPATCDATLEVVEDKPTKEIEVATTMQIKPVKAAPKMSPIDRLGALAATATVMATKARELSDQMKALASDLEVVAIEIEDDVTETAKMADQLKQLKQLLKGLD